MFIYFISFVLILNKLTQIPHRKTNFRTFVYKIIYITIYNLHLNNETIQEGLWFLYVLLEKMDDIYWICLFFHLVFVVCKSPVQVSETGTRGLWV